MTHRVKSTRLPIVAALAALLLCTGLAARAESPTPIEPTPAVSVAVADVQVLAAATTIGGTPVERRVAALPMAPAVQPQAAAGRELSDGQMAAAALMMIMLILFRRRRATDAL